MSRNESSYQANVTSIKRALSTNPLVGSGKYHEVSQEDAPFVEAAYGVTARSNWEGENFLQRAVDDTSLAARFKLDLEAVPAKLAECHSRLLQSVQPAFIRAPTIRCALPGTASSYPASDDAPALLRDRPLKEGMPTVYVCEGFDCKNPVTSIPELRNLL